MVKYSLWVSTEETSERYPVNNVSLDFEIVQDGFGRHHAMVEVFGNGKYKALWAEKTLDLPPTDKFDVPLNGPGLSKAREKVRRAVAFRYKK